MRPEGSGAASLYFGSPPSVLSNRNLELPENDDISPLESSKATAFL